MKQRLFEHSHQQQWQELEQFLDKTGKNKQENAQFPYLYRQVCHHLALARDRHYTPYLTDRLNQLVLRGHQRLYTQRSRLLVESAYFIGRRFPQCVRQEAFLVSLSSVIFFGSLWVMFVAIQFNPNLVYYVLDVEQVMEFEKMYAPNNKHLGWTRGADSDFLMFGYYIYNNISIGFQIFAGGLLLGLGSLFFLLINGIIIGSVAGHLTHIGYTETFYTFIVGHSGPELIAIVLAGAAGLKLGYAVVAPGRLSRLHALHQAAITSIHLVYGVIFLLLLAAFIEAFWSSNGYIDPLVKYGVGLSLWALLIVYLKKVGHRAT